MSLELEIRLHTYQVAMNTWSGTLVIFTDLSDWLMCSEPVYTACSHVSGLNNGTATWKGGLSSAFWFSYEEMFKFFTDGKRENVENMRCKTFGGINFPVLYIAYEHMYLFVESYHCQC